MENSGAELINDTGKSCWICLEGTEAENIDTIEGRKARQRHWVSPCECRGSLYWVHEDCLLRWVDTKKNNPDASYPPPEYPECPHCKTPYRIIEKTSIYCTLVEKIAYGYHRYVVSSILLGGVAGAVYGSFYFLGKQVYLLANRVDLWPDLIASTASNEAQISFSTSYIISQISSDWSGSIVPTMTCLVLLGVPIEEPVPLADFIPIVSLPFVWSFYPWFRDTLINSMVKNRLNHTTGEFRRRIRRSIDMLNTEQVPAAEDGEDERGNADPSASNNTSADPIVSIEINSSSVFAGKNSPLTPVIFPWIAYGTSRLVFSVILQKLLKPLLNPNNSLLTSYYTNKPFYRLLIGGMFCILAKDFFWGIYQLKKAVIKANRRVMNYSE